MTIDITGGEQLAALDIALRRAGERELLEQLREGTSAPLRAIIPSLRASARATLPQRGGLAGVVATSRFDVRIRYGGRSPGVQLVGTNAIQIRRLDRGLLRHPVYARGPRQDWRWVRQRVPSGWFTNPTDDARPRIARAVGDALQAVAEQVEIDMRRR